ncbi:MAG TPA: hypothetical protein VE622_05190 [Nitrososphaeraceae archaeon]|jgi:hypothetical protein|nr:hypothetical protein [Nitrososphaeraceae archaeon]
MIAVITIRRGNAMKKLKMACRIKVEGEKLMVNYIVYDKWL